MNTAAPGHDEAMRSCAPRLLVELNAAQQPRARALVCLGAVVAAIALARLSYAHPGFPGSAIARIEVSGRFTIHVRLDALAFALNETPADIADDSMRRLLAGPRQELDASLEQARQRFVQQFELTANGERVAITLVNSPTRGQIEEAEARSDPVRLPIMLEFAGEAQLAPGTNRLSLKFPEVMGNVIVTIERPGREPFSLPLSAGERTPELPMSMSQASGEDEAEAHETWGEDPSTLEVAWRFIVIGFEHIIPEGA